MKAIAIFAPLTALMLAACAPAAAPDAGLAPVAAPDAVVPVTSLTGLQERAPDLCKGSTYVPYLGQPGTVIPTLGISREFRVVQWRGIEPQDYNPNRIVFRLDAAGNIYNIDCG